MVPVSCLGLGKYSVMNCPGLHHLFAKGFKAGRHQTVTLLLYPSLGPATDNFSQQAELVIYNYLTIYFIQYCVHCNLTSTRGIHRQMDDLY